MANFNLGDEITIPGVCRGGVINEQAPESDLQKWRVAELSGDDVRLDPLHPDGTLDKFNAVAGRFWIRIDRASDPQ